ncbi:MAG: TldD/PmbA family protein [Halanaerobiales bacterium]|nr:TldD/PmbA family protein [Halanaerobiales bacterium]
MKERLRAAFTKEGYQDIRYENLQIIGIDYQGQQLKDISVSKKSGGHARGFYNGGWGHFSFTDINEIEQGIHTAIEQAKLVSQYKNEVNELASAPVVEDQVRVNPKLDPRKVALEKKQELLNKYNQLALGVEGITMTQAKYYEQYSHKYFANNQGTYIDQEELICGLRITFFAKRDRLTQKTNISFGGSNDFSLLLDKEEEILEAAQRTLALLDAESVKAGNYTVIMDQSAAGVFIHEAFGHLSEADGIADSDALRETMKLGRVFGKPLLNVIDDGNLPGHPGSIAYDDDGVRAAKTNLIKEGVLTGRLHSRETAGKMAEPLSGNSRAKDFSFAPVVRMSNIYIDNRESTFEELISSTEDGLYLIGAAGGQTSGDTFTLGVQYGYRIRNGKIAEMVRDIVVNCNLFETMANISGVANDLKFSRIGGCGKAGQILITSGKGAPHIKIDNITIGGQ